MELCLQWPDHMWGIFLISEATFSGAYGQLTQVMRKGLETKSCEDEL